MAAASGFGVDGVRRFALSLPETTTADHHGLDSFRICGRIFATIPDEHHVRIMVDEAAILTSAAANPGVCEPFYWGKRLACVVVDLDAADREVVEELVHEAWRRKAPKRLLHRNGDRQT